MNIQLKISENLQILSKHRGLYYEKKKKKN